MREDVFRSTPESGLNSRFSSDRRRSIRHRDRQRDSCRVATQDHQNYQPPHRGFWIRANQDRRIAITY
jgi:hypothetical protein